jgi:hypothetical protein
LSHLPHNQQCPNHTHARFSAAASALSPLAHAFLALFLQPLLPLEPAFQLQCSRKVGMPRPSRQPHYIESSACGRASPGPVQIGCQSRRPPVGSPLFTIHEYGLEIGRSFQTTSQQIQSFITFMSQQAQTAAWFAEASQMLSQGLRDSCEGKTIEHQANLERAVWDVIKNPGWVFFEKNASRNMIKNRNALKKAAAKELLDSATIKTWEEISLSAPASSAAAQPVNFNFLNTCSKCSGKGFLVLCEKSGCLNRYHWACSGVEEHDVHGVQYFCQTCDPIFHTRIRERRAYLDEQKRRKAKLRAQKKAAEEGKKADEAEKETKTRGSRKRSHNSPADSDSSSEYNGSMSAADAKAAAAAAATKEEGSEQETVSLSSGDGAGDSEADAQDDVDNISDSDSVNLDAGFIPSDDMHGNPEADAQDDDNDDHGIPTVYDIQQVFNIVDEAIVTLEGLDAGLPVHDVVLYNDLASKLTRVASFLARMYSNDAYMDLVSGTLEELCDYAGQQEPKRFRSKAFLVGLSKFGFCISPRMWKKEEILCIAISILDIRLDFQGINQKDGKDLKTSFRGMAVLNARIQRIFYKRLHLYGFVNPRYHPERLQAFSSVVINGGGCWQQSATWEFCKLSCFRMDTTAAPFIVRVASDVGALECAGVYVASTTKKNGEPVYVQVSKKEFYGFPGQKGFKSCLKDTELIRTIKRFTTNNEGNRVDACSPRVLVCLNADRSEWGIQLLPGYCSDLCIMRFSWNQGQTSNIQRFASFDFNKFEAKMQPCALSITALCHSAVDCLNDNCLPNGHVFSFGTSKIMKSCFKNAKDAASFHASPLGPQGWHSDGPRMYNDSIFDTFGNLRPDAVACARRAKWKGRWTSLWNNPLQLYFSDHIGILQESFSALFGIFKGTFIETPPVMAAGRNQSPLKVHVPLGCAVVFTFAWKHRGKGDDPKFQVTPQCPVSVHARPHFYAYSADIRKLPSVDCETSLEFISICSQPLVSKGSQSQLLDCLQTFDRLSAPGHFEDPDVHELFPNQRDLDAFVQLQLGEQLASKERVETATECRNWYLLLDSSNKVQLRFENGDNRAACCVTITSANFDSEMPSFRDSSDQLYNVIGKPATIASFPDDSAISASFRVDLALPGSMSMSIEAVLMAANKATQALSENWCESSLLHVLSILNVDAISNCTLTIAQTTAKEQSGHKYGLFLEGRYCRDNSTFQKVFVRPDCEGVAELYRQCLRQLVSAVCDRAHDSITKALKSLEQSLGLFNVGVENLLTSLQQSPSSLVVKFTPNPNL